MSQPSATCVNDPVASANAILIENVYQAFARGDVPAVIAKLADDVFWHVPGRGPLSRDYRGPADVLGFFQTFMELSDNTFRLQVDNILAKGDQVVVLCTETARRGARSWSSPQVHVWTLASGKISAFHEYPGDGQTEDEFWAAKE